MSDGGVSGWEHLRIMVVDDSDLGRKAVANMLKYLGIATVEAVSGSQALEYMRENSVDLILMDIQMPDMDGLEATRRIRTLEHCSSESLPIIAMTANTFIEQRDANLAAGMNGQLNKPVELSALVAQLQQYFPNSQVDGIISDIITTDEVYRELMPALPGVDVRAGLRHVMGERDSYLRQLHKFVDQFGAFDAEIQRCIVDSAWDDARRLAHTLKGVAATLGADVLSWSAQQLEQQLRDGEFPEALLSAAREMRRLRGCIAALPCPGGQDDATTDQPGDGAELLSLLPGLLDALRGLRVNEIRQAFAPVKQQKWPHDYDNFLQKLDKLVNSYQYAEAAKLVKTVLHQDGGDGGT